MATYLILNIVFITLVMLMGKIKVPRTSKPFWVALFCLLLLTLIFDALLISLDFFYYDESKLLGIYLGNVPIEDLAYPLFAIVLAAHFWKRFERDGHV